MAYAFKYFGHWYIRYKDRSGSWRKKACGITANRRDAEYLANEYSARELNYRHHAPVRIIKSSLADSLAKFRDEELPQSVWGADKQQSSIRREQSAIRNVITYVNEQRLVTFPAFDKDAARKYMEYRAAMGMSARTRREERRVLRKFYAWAKKNHLCVDDPTDEIVVPRSPKKHPRFFTEEELKRIFERAKEPYRTIFIFLYLTGLRSGELSNLEWRDYDRQRKALTIRVVSADKKNRTPGNKTKREESIPLCEDAVRILERRRSANDSDRFIFLNGASRRLDDENVYKACKAVLKSLGIKDGSPHTFRHTFASHLVIAGVSIYIVKDLMRHKSIVETEIYAHLSQETTKTAVERLPRINHILLYEIGSQERKIA